MLLIKRYRPDIKAPLTKINASSDDPKATSFYTAHEILTLQMKFQSDLGQMRFQLMEFDKETLVSIPMNAEYNRCLCISVDGQAGYVVVIDKILSVIG
jgi:hypothetical protein